MFYILMIDIDELSLDIQYNINKDENKDDNRHGRQTPTPPVGWGGNTSPNSMNYYPIPKPVPFHVSKYFPLDPGKQAEMMERKFREVREQDAKGDRQGGMKRKDGPEGWSERGCRYHHTTDPSTRLERSKSSKPPTTITNNLLDFFSSLRSSPSISV